MCPRPAQDAGPDSPSEQGAGQAGSEGPLRRELDELTALRLADDLVGARRTLHAILAGETFSALLEADEAQLLACLDELKEAALALSDLRACGTVLEERVRVLSEARGPEDAELLKARRNLGAVLAKTGELGRARELFEAVLAARERSLPPESPDLLESQMDLGTLFEMQGDLQRALGLQEEVVEVLSRLREPDDVDLLRAKTNLASTVHGLGDLRRARELQTEVLDAYERLFPPEEERVLRAKTNLAFTLGALGEIERERELLEGVHDVQSRLLPADHPSLLVTRFNLANSLRTSGDSRGALGLYEDVYESWLRTLSPEHPNLAIAQLNLSMTLQELGELEESRALAERVHSLWSRRFPPDHPLLLRARQNLAIARRTVGDLAGALALDESVLAIRKEKLPPDHPDLLASMHNVALTRAAMGDEEGALEMDRQVLMIRAEVLPTEHPDLLRSKNNIAGRLLSLGRTQEALALQEEVLEVHRRTLVEEDDDRLRSELNLATTRGWLGDREGQLELLQHAVAVCRRVFPEEHILRLGAERDEADLLFEQDRLEEALALYDALLAVEQRILPAGNPRLLSLHQKLARVRLAAGDRAGCREATRSLLEGQLTRVRELQLDSPRSARDKAHRELERIPVILRLCDALRAGEPREGNMSVEEEALEETLFTVLEGMRLVSTSSTAVAVAAARSPQLLKLRQRLALARAEVERLGLEVPAEESALAEWRRALFEGAEARDALERELRAQLAGQGILTSAPTVAMVAESLAPDAALVTFLAYERQLGDEPDPQGRTERSLLALLVTPEARLHRLALGPLAPIESELLEWRSALGRPVVARGVSVSEENEEGAAADAERAGTELRVALLDPILELVPDTRVLHVVADGVVHLVALDALPMGAVLAGERLTIRYEASVQRLVAPWPAVTGEPALLAFGGIDYDALPAESGEPVLLVAAAPVGLERGAAGSTGLTDEERFPVLPGAARELGTVAAAFQESFGREPELVEGAAASKQRLHELAPGARWLHLATHGWFAPPSPLAPEAAALSLEAWSEADRVVKGFAPGSLCGLALAGANRGPDADGTVVGILTAEELAALDLSGCELAVLSACETNVGLRRGGQGIQSLQSALHAAGARTAITSLWKVDDAATRRLFELFYAKLWKDGFGKADALWEAKMALRAEGHGPRDWAAWVLSGDPD